MSEGCRPEQAALDALRDEIVNPATSPLALAGLFFRQTTQALDRSRLEEQTLAGAELRLGDHPRGGVVANGLKSAILLRRELVEHHEVKVRRDKAHEVRRRSVVRAGEELAFTLHKRGEELVNSTRTPFH